MIKIIPSCGLLLEFSGEIGDACWVNSYENIGETFPNITALIIVDCEKDLYKAVGSLLVIKLESTPSGKNILILRGINPVENFINTIDPKSFFDCIHKYMLSIANKEGARLAISIDRRGGASTNRRELFDYLDSIKDELEKTTFLKEIPSKHKEGAKTNFNNYPLEDCTYYLS